MDWYVKRNNGPTIFYISRNLVHDTLLYRMCLSRSAHDEFDRDIAYLYTGWHPSMSMILLVYVLKDFIIGGIPMVIGRLKYKMRMEI